MRNLTVVACALLLGGACGRRAEKPPAPAEVEPASLAAFAPLPASFDAAGNPPSAEKVALGRMLFFDPRLSKNHDVSCNSCHDLARYGVDGLPTSRGHKGQTGTRNAPTVYNAAAHVAQFWDGRAPTVEEQAKGPILNPIEMASPGEAAVVAVLRSIPGYVDAFARAFPGDPDPVTYQHLADAIGAFERRLVTPSRWDRFLAGNLHALDAAERRGLRVFLTTGCVGCHEGAAVGGGMYQKIGLVRAYANSADPGRFAVTKSEADRMVFKVPSLRNVEWTAPYLHDGSAADLPTAVKLMAELQLGRTMPPGDVQAVVAFLRSMTGELPTDLVRAPALPPSGPTTPSADPT